MLDVLKEVGIDFLIGCIVFPLYWLYTNWAWKGINKWEWAKKIVDMENKLVPYLFLVLVITLPVLVAKLFVLPFI